MPMRIYLLSIQRDNMYIIINIINCGCLALLLIFRPFLHLLHKKVYIYIYISAPKVLKYERPHGHYQVSYLTAFTKINYRTGHC